MTVEHTCAIDTNLIRLVFDTIKDKIFVSRMEASGIVI